MFGTRISGEALDQGFSCVLGNPPWELMQVNESEFLVGIGLPEIANLRGQHRKLAIQRLERDEPTSFVQLSRAREATERRKSFINESGRYPRRGSGKLNLYALFAEATDQVTGGFGRWGLVLPTGIATDMGTSELLRSWTDSRRLRAFYAFNEATPYFEGVTQPFALVTVGQPSDDAMQLAADLIEVRDLKEPGRAFDITPDAIRRISPNTGAIPLFGSAHAADIVERIYTRGEPLRPTSGGSWSVRFRQGDVNLTADSRLFSTERPAESSLRLFEGKMVWVFEPRYQHYVDGQVVALTADELRSPSAQSRPQYWVRSTDLDPATREGIAAWRAVFRDTTNTNNPRTLVPAVVPEVCLGNTLPFVIGSPEQCLALVAVWGTFTVDYVTRNRLSGKHVNFFIADQLPVPPWDVMTAWLTSIGCSPLQWLEKRMGELTYTSTDMTGFAHAIGVEGAPFVWDRTRRMHLASEIDALVAHLFGLGIDDIDHILGTFAKVRQQETDEFGEFRTRRLILECLNDLIASDLTGIPYTSPITPPPGQGHRHPKRTSEADPQR